MYLHTHIHTHKRILALCDHLLYTLPTFTLPPFLLVGQTVLRCTDIYDEH